MKGKLTHHRASKWFDLNFILVTCRDVSRIGVSNVDQLFSFLIFLIQDL